MTTEPITDAATFSATSLLATSALSAALALVNVPATVIDFCVLRTARRFRPLGDGISVDDTTLISSKISSIDLTLRRAT